MAAYNTALAAVQTALADRDSTMMALRGVLTQLGAYVDNVTNGDPVKIESSGMSVRAAAAPLTVSQVLNLVVTAGDFDGSLDLGWDTDPAEISTEIQISADPVTTTSWIYKMTATKSSATLTGLTSGAKIWVRVRSLGAGNTVGPWSDPATKTVP